jgi:RimJ/RimL family protein N-acetyltransferase
VETLTFWGEQLSSSGASGWWLHYILMSNAHPGTLVGTVSYKGPPVNGIVEIGYSVVPSWQRRGVATEASRALIEAAWSRGAEVVVAHTLPDLKPSIRVLEKLGFAPRSPTNRASSRSPYDASKCTGTRTSKSCALTAANLSSEIRT